MAARFVSVGPLLPERFEASQIKLFPARVIGALIHEERREHRAGASPRHSARIPYSCFEMVIELPRNIFGRRQFPLQQKNAGLAQDIGGEFAAHVLSHLRILVHVVSNSPD
jgi:hypothetical protein